MANKMCTYGGCKQVATVGSRCAKHKAERYKRKDYDHHKHGRLGNIYNSARWKTLRERKIQQSPLCELCLTIGKTVPAIEIDHQLEVIDFRELIWSLDNLVSLCPACHRQKTALYKQLRKSNPAKLMWLLDQMRPLNDEQKNLFKNKFKL